MLTAHAGAAPPRPITVAPHTPPDADGAVWLDLLDPTEEERDWVERATGLRVPTKAELSEIESSSRLLVDGDTLTLSTPMSYRSEEGSSRIAPLGFVVSPQRMLTVRFAHMPVFDLVQDRFAKDGGDRRDGQPCSISAFLTLLEAIVDRIADVLERVGGQLDTISHRIFRREDRRRRADRADAELRGTLRAIGRAGDALSNIRDSLLGVSRISAYAADVASTWIPKSLAPRFKTLRRDLASLGDYDTQLANKVQFLLDATLGFINIEQNNGIKILTVVSVVGVPPTLVASMYGMNFQNMPELHWQYGYAYGLAMILLSAVVPVVWFKWKGWI